MPAKKIHVLQVTILRYPEIVGGVDTMVSMLINALLPHANCSVLVPGSWEDTELSVKQSGEVTVYSIRFRMPFDKKHPVKNFLAWLVECPRTLITLSNIVKNGHIDIIHLHLLQSFHYYFRLLKWLSKTPYIVTLHRSDVVEFDKLSLSDKLLAKFALAGSSYVNAVSAGLASLANERFSTQKKIVPIYNGLNLDYIENIYAQSQYNRFTYPYFVMIGSFDPYKDHLTAIKAWAYLKKTHPHVHLIIAGEGDLQPQYESCIKEGNCQDTVHIIGQVSHAEVIGLLKYALGMVFPSINEGLGYVLLEAGAIGTPVICSNIEPFIEIVEHERNGLLFPVQDSQAIADAVVRIIDNPDWAKQLGMELKTKIHQNFSAEKMASNYLEVYQSILN